MRPHPVSPAPATCANDNPSRLNVKRHGIYLDGRRYWDPALAAWLGRGVDVLPGSEKDSLLVTSPHGFLICNAKLVSVHLPPPTQSWMGDLHRLFSASPADVETLVLRKRIAALEAENARLRDEAGADETARAVDYYYHGSADGRVRASHAGSAFVRELAAWPPVYEQPRINPILRFFKWLAE
jgi:hypothetical protein